MTKLSIVFMGTPDFAVPTLRALHERHHVLTVVTQPDRPQGRGRVLSPPPVKVAAQELGLEIFQPEKLRKRAVRERLAGLQADYFVVAAYGMILSPKMLAVPRLGCVNVHASLLPRYRGAAPIHWAIVRGERRSGVSIMEMDAGMDTGPTLLTRGIDMDPRETAGSLHDRLAPLGAELLLEALDGLVSGQVKPRPQPDEDATYAPMLAKGDGEIDWHRPAHEVDCWIRGMDPWPGAFTQLEGKRVKLFDSVLVVDPGGRPGEVLDADQRGLLLACGEDAIRVSDLQIAGRRRMSATAFLTGRPVARGTILGEDSSST